MRYVSLGKKKKKSPMLMFLLCSDGRLSPTTHFVIVELTSQNIKYGW